MNDQQHRTHLPPNHPTYPVNPVNPVILCKNQSWPRHQFRAKQDGQDLHDLHDFVALE